MHERTQARSRSILLAAGRLVGEPRGGAGYGACCRNRTVVWHSWRRHMKFRHSTWRQRRVGSDHRSDSDYISLQHQVFYCLNYRTVIT